jgi:hypothetical protein
MSCRGDRSIDRIYGVGSIARCQLLARHWPRWAAMTGPAGVIHRLGWPQKLGVAANLPSIATRAVRALSDQQSARSTSPLGSSEHKLKRGAASLPRFWIERPKAWPLRHIAGTGQSVTLPLSATTPPLSRGACAYLTATVCIELLTSQNKA